MANTSARTQMRFHKSRKCLLWIPQYSFSMMMRLLFLFWVLLMGLIPQNIKKGPQFKVSRRRLLLWAPNYMYSLLTKCLFWALSSTPIPYFLNRITKSKTISFVLYFFNWILSMSLIMPKHIKGDGGQFKFPNCIYCVLRKCIFWVLSVGPIPLHIAFIMDGNRRFARNRGIRTGSGYHAGFLSLLTVLEVCYELGVKYVSIYAFSIDNFRRKSEEVEFLMKMLGDYLSSLTSGKNIIERCGIRINFVGNLSLLPESLRLGISQAMEATRKNKGMVLSICVAYTSTDEIVHAVQESCKEKLAKIEGIDNVVEGVVTIRDLERHMYMSDLPDPDLLIRSSGRSRLSNFLLWQTTYSCLEAPNELWPDMSAKTMFWSILNYQRVHSYLKLRKLSIS